MIKSKKDYLSFTEQDRIALGKSSNFLTNIKQLIWPDLIWEYEKTLRKLEFYSNTGRSKKILYIINWLICKRKFRKLSYKLGIQIGLNVFGPGLSIAHFGSIVVSEHARIGKNCRIHSCVNIGASGGKNEAPNIGDNCYIGPGAKLFGGINLGDNITIGANAVVNRSCAKNNIVLAGIPAKVVKENTESWVIFNHIQNSKSE